MPVLLYKHGAQPRAWDTRYPVNIWMKERMKKSEKMWEEKGKERSKEEGKNRKKQGGKKREWILWIPSSPQQNPGSRWPWGKRNKQASLAYAQLPSWQKCIFILEYQRVASTMFFLQAPPLNYSDSKGEWMRTSRGLTKPGEWNVSLWIYWKNPCKFYFYTQRSHVSLNIKKH